MQADQAKVGMIIFLLIFFLIYGGLHLYVFLKTKNAIVLGAMATMGLIAFMALMIFAPILIRLLERVGYEPIAYLLSHVGYTWTGIVFLFFSCALLLDVYRLVIFTAGFVLQKNLSSITPSAFYSFIIPFSFAIIISAYGYFEAQNIRAERLVIQTSKIPEEIGTVKIVQIADIHLGLIVREKRLNLILQKVKAEKPDILVSTGDLVDGQMCRLNHLVEMLQEIKPHYGKFAVTGNHEFYAGLAQALECTKKAGFNVLRGKAVNVSDFISIAGVDDPAGKIYESSGNTSEKELLAHLSRERFTLLLKHQPITDRESSSLFDLQLSGHTHKGQIFPFTLITRLRYSFNSGYFKLPNNSHLYVSRGSGTWGPPIRFLAPPEVTVIELVHGNNSK
jgi:predicted MPP superfamily phosphohydrolase